MDRLGVRRLVPSAAVAVGIGALLFATGGRTVASAGRFLQGAGGVFALVGAIYIATTNFPPSRAATLIGATQMFGMAGGSAGQFVVGPMIAGGLSWRGFWIGMGIAGLVIGAVLFLLLPKEERAEQPTGWLKTTAGAFGTVFRNPQSILCGLIAGLLFIPTTIFDMVWGVRFLQEAHGFDYASAVMRSAMVPFGWIIGCPLLGCDLRPDRAPQAGDHRSCGRAARMPWRDSLRPHRRPAALPARPRRRTGVGRGDAAVHGDQGGQPAAVRRHRHRGRQLPELHLQRPARSGVRVGSPARVRAAATMRLEHYQTTFEPLLYGVAFAIVLSFFLKETGPAVRAPSSVAKGEVRR